MCARDGGGCACIIRTRQLSHEILEQTDDAAVLDLRKVTSYYSSQHRTPVELLMRSLYIDYYLVSGTRVCTIVSADILSL